MPNFACQDCHTTNGSKHDFLVPGDTTVHDPKDPVTRTSATLDYTKFVQVFAQDKCKTCHSGNAQQTVDKVKQQQADIEKRLEALSKINDEWSKKVTTMDKNDPKVKAYT